MFFADRQPALPVDQPGLSVLSHLRSHFRFSSLWRIFLVMLMVSLSTVGMWSSLLAPSAYAASLHQPSSLAHPRPPRRGQRVGSSGIAACPKLTQSTKTPKVSLDANALNGLGDMGSFTFFQRPLTDRIQLKVNVANGNLVLETSQLHIHGTGIDLDIGAVYNGLPAAATLDLGAKWNLTVGTGVFLSINTQTGAVSLHTSTGAVATYLPDARSAGGYDEPPNLDATLFHNQDGSYTLVFQKSGECFGFTSAGQESYDEDKNTNLITFSYTGSQLSTITDTQNRQTSFKYDSNGRIKQITDPSGGRVVQYLYQDGNNNLTDIIDANGKTTHFTYTGHDLTAITDPMTNETDISYQTGDLIASVQDAMKNPVTSFDDDGSGDSDCSQQPSLACTVVTDPRGGKTTYYCSGLQVQYVYDQLGHKQSNSYTPDGNVTSYSDDLNDTSQFIFDPQGNNNVSSIVDGNKATTGLFYTDTNNPYAPTQVTDPQNNSISYGYDPTNGNLLTAQQQSSGSSLSYSYYADDGSSGNGRGTLKSITDGDGNVTSFVYDQYGNLKTETPQSPLQPQSFVEDDVSRVSSVTDGNGVTVGFVYDPLDRLKQITYTKGGSSHSINYGYDDDGNLTSEVDGTGTTSLKVNADNQLIKKTLPSGVIFTSTYDHIGNLKTFTDGGTDTLGLVTYDYDLANRMITLTEPGGAQTSYGYDNANRRTSISYPNNTGMQIGYDAAGHQTSDVSGVLNGKGGFSTIYSSFQFSYKLPSGLYSNLLQSVYVLDPLTWNTTQSYYTRSYSYDAMSRLTVDDIYNSSKVEVEKYSYSYDKAGNRLSATVFSTGSATSYSYPSANELGSQTQGGSTTSYAYDGNGNLSSETPGLSFTYNSKNQTTAIGSNSYTYSGATQADRVQSNEDTFNDSGLGMSSESESGGKTYYVRCSCGLLNSERTPDGKAHYYLFDNLDSVVGLTDSQTGNKDNSYDYDPYGQMKAQVEGETNPWKYASGYLDSGTGLYHFGARYYDPSLGRWTQQDPVAGSLGDLGAANRYVYANDNPVNLVDPSGKFGVGLLFANAVPIGVAIDLTPQDLAFLSTPLGGLLAGAIGAIAATFVNTYDPGLGVVAGLLTAYLVGNVSAIKQACPGGASILYLFGDIEPFYTCV